MNRSICFRSAAALLAVPLFAACSEKEPIAAERTAAASVPGAPPEAATDLVASNAPASDVKESSELIEFAYSYPQEAARIPRLAAWLDNDRQVKREALVATARRDQAAAQKNGYPYRTNSHLQSWRRITDTPSFLSLSSEVATYTGGAHGMVHFQTLLWDRNRRLRVSPLDLFTSGEAFDAAIRDAFCEGIVKAKAAKGIQSPAEPDSPFARCPAASAQTVWLGSSDGRRIDRLTIAIAPYEIGPYAEGSYMIDLPMTPALIRAVKPEYARDVAHLN